MRRYAPEAFEVGVVQEYWDASGNKVNRCSERQQGKGSPIPTQKQDFGDVPAQTAPRATPQSDPTKNFDPNKSWALSYVEADDEDIIGIVLLLPVRLQIARYTFYFTERIQKRSFLVRLKELSLIFKVNRYVRKNVDPALQKFSRTSISTYETRDREPPLDVLLRYAQTAGSVWTRLLMTNWIYLPGYRLSPSIQGRKPSVR